MCVLGCVQTDSTHSGHLLLLILVGWSYSWFITCHRECVWGRSSCFYLLSYPVQAARAGIQMFVFDCWMMSWHSCGPPELWLMIYRGNKILFWGRLWCGLSMIFHLMECFLVELTHGKLACLYCMENNKASTLTNGSKASFFYCHHCFLPHNYRYRKNIKDFFVGRVEKDVASWLVLKSAFL